MTRRLALLLAALLLAAHPALAQRPALTGTVTYPPGRENLMPWTHLELELVDLDRPGTLAGRIAFLRVRTEARAEIPFTLPYDPARIAPQGRYALQAMITDDNRVLYRTPRPQPVLRAANDTTIALALRPDPARPLRYLVEEELVERIWVLQEMGIASLTDRSQFTLSVDMQGRTSGRAGCTRFRIGHGSSRITTTRTPCATRVPREEEQEFLRRLNNGRAWLVEGNTLRITNEGEVDVLRFTRQD